MVLNFNLYRRRVVARFFAILDSQGVVFFQAIVYTWQAISGVYNAHIAHGAPPDVQKALGSFTSLWLALCIGCMLCMFGKVMSSTQWYWLRTAGYYFQFAGDVAALGMFTGYVLAHTQESKWGDPMTSPFTYAGLAMCAFFLCWRDLRRIAQAERRGQARQ